MIMITIPSPSHLSLSRMFNTFASITYYVLQFYVLPPEPEELLRIFATHNALRSFNGLEHR